MSERSAFARAKGGGYSMRLNADERGIIVRLLDELSALLTDPDDHAMTRRLFPVVHRDNPDQEAEYQRLMRDELVSSRLAGIATVKAVLTADRNAKKVAFDEVQLVAFMQAVNAVRLVLGTMLDITEDDEEGPEHGLVPEYQLYGYLSWLLDSAVHALSGI